MAKEIALKLKITSQGEEKVISNLNELESELKILQDTLKTLDFGTPAYKEAISNISKLKTKLDEVDKASEGIGAEKKFRALGDAINVVTGAFQVASGALSLFISNEQTLEEVQRAEAAALNVVNIALGINAINTALVESATLRASVATKINEAATKAAAIAQAAYNAVLNANPVVLFITAIAALTGAIYLLITAQDEDTDATEANSQAIKDQIKVEGGLIDVKRKAAIELKQQITILTDSIATREIEIQTLEDLKKTYPGLNAFIDENNQLTKQGIEFINLQIQAEEARAAINKINETRLDAEIERETALADLRANGPGILTKALALTNGFLTADQIAYGRIADKYNEKTAGLAAVQQKYTTQLENTLVQLKPLNRTLSDTAKAEELAAKATETATDAVDKNLLKITERIKALDGLAKKIDEAQKAEIRYTSDLLNNQKEIITNQENYIKERTEFLKTESKKLIDELNNYLFKTIPNESDVKKLSDGYTQLFINIREEIKKTDSALSFTATTGWEGFVKVAEKAIPTIGETLKNVSDESKKSFVEYFNNLDERVVALKTSIQGPLLGVFDLKPDNETLLGLLEVEEKIASLRADRVKLGLTDKQLEDTSLYIIKQQFGIQQKLIKISKEQGELLFNKIQAEERGDTKAAEGFKARYDALEQEGEKYQEIARSILTGVIRTDEFVNGLKEINKESDKNVSKIKLLGAEIDKTFTPEQAEGLKKYFKQNAQDYLTIFTDVLDNEEKYFNKLGEDGIKALFSGIDEGLKDVENKTREELENIQKFLKLFGDEFAKDFGLTENPFLKTLNAISKKLKELPSESQDSFNKSFSSIKDVADKVLQAFSQVSTQLSSIVQQQNSLLLEQIDYQQAQALKAVEELGDESVEGQKIRDAEKLKVEKEYQKKRFDVEKKARVQELQFALANSIAQGAQAIINAYATLPIPAAIPFSLVLAGLTAFQVGVINDQLQFTQNKAYIGRTGGLVEGSSHDTYGGGVPTMLEGGEFILNREAVRAYGDQISMMSSATGGKPMSIDDSRIVQAISKQNLSTKTPLKAYVLYNDIQDTTKLNKKIAQLARL
jgi:hypothetical protein